MSRDTHVLRDLGNSGGHRPCCPSGMGFTRYLISEGDQALANHDGRGFAAIARRLSRRVGDPLRDELLGLALLGATRLDVVAQRWPALCADILARVELAGT